MKRGTYLLLAALLLGAGFAPAAITGCAKAPAVKRLYHCPMHPTYTSDHPADCPICNMKMVPVESPAADTLHSMSGEAGGDHTTVFIDPASARRAGIVTTRVRRDHLRHGSRTVGDVSVDASRRVAIQARAGGWIRFLNVAATGREVHHGDPLAVLESPDLLAAQQDYVAARKTVATLPLAAAAEVRSSLEAVVDAAGRRLDLLGLPSRMRDDLDRGGSPQPLVPILSPQAGVVIEKNVVEGMRVEPGMTLFAIADLSRIWVEARLFENDARRLRAGDRVTVTPSGDAGKPIAGQISEVVPQVDSATRTAIVRIGAENPAGRLVPGGFVDVEFQLDEAEGIVVPDDSILDTGTRSIVFVVDEHDHYAPREVTVGFRSEGESLVTGGLSDGEKIVTGAAFLVDSESRLRAAIARSGAGEAPPAMPADHGGHR